MTTLLIVIYVAFISLGLPDSVLGSAWPIMQGELSAPLPLAGYISMVTAAGTIVSSLCSNLLIARFGVGKVTAVSVLMTAAGLLGIALTPNAWAIFLFAIPLGLGGGSVDAVLNNVIALHYAARHMSWLHCFWGVGATAGPMILSFQLARNAGWRGAYGVISGIQFVLAIALFFALPLWKRLELVERDEGEKTYLSNRDALKLPLIKPALLGFTFFCAVETTCGLWASSYLHGVRGLSIEDAALGASMFYGAITLGRFICGFITLKLSSRMLIRLGQCVCLAGAALIALPLPAGCSLLGVGVVGLGTSPIYPSMLHETPARFGAKNSQAVVGLQMAFAYIGSTLMAPLFGQVADLTTLKLYPFFLIVCTLVMLIASEYVAKKVAARRFRAFVPDFPKESPVFSISGSDKFSSYLR